jgi:hypothetical protein
MALESGVYISDLVITNPPGSDPKSQMDDHLRLIKSTVKTTFPNIAGAMTMTHTELNTVTSRGLIAGQTWTGTHDYTGGVLRSATPVGATDVASKGYVDNLAYSTAIAPRMLRVARTSDTILAPGDATKLFDITSGTFAQTFTASASLGDGWYVLYKNTGTGVVTLTPNGAETISGASSLLLLRGDFYIVQCDGSNLNAVKLDSPPQSMVSTSQLDKTSDTTLADIVGFSANLVGGGTYKFSIIAFTTLLSSGSAGVKFGFTGTATATSFVAAMQASQISGQYNTVKVTSLASTLGNDNAIGSVVQIDGVIVVNAGGTFKIQFAQQASNATASSVLVNSTFTVERIA